MGMSAGDNYTTKGVEQKSGSVDYSMHDKEQTNNATIGMGSIIVGGEELGSLDNGENSEGAGGFVANNTSLAGLNRDISQSQVITKDLSVNPIHVEYTDYAPKLDEEGNEMSYVESLKDGIMDWVDPRDEAVETVDEISQIPGNPVWVYEKIKDYTGKELTWKKGGDAIWKAEDNTYDSLDENANNIGISNTTPDENLEGTEVEYDNILSWIFSANEGSLISETTNLIPGMNSMSVMHDKWSENKILKQPVIMQTTIPPATLINYYGLIGKSMKRITNENNNQNENTNTQN